MAVRVATGGFIQMADTSGASIVGTPAAKKMTISRAIVDIPRSGADATGFQPTNNLRTEVSGNARVTGTFEGFLDDTNILDPADLVNEAAAAATITLYFNRTTTAGGAGTIQQMTVSGWLTKFATGARASGEPCPISGAFVGTGKPTFAKNT